MKQEDQELLLKDICARLPYGVKGKCEIDASYDTSFDTKLQTHTFNAIVYGIKENSLLVTPLIENQDELEFANEEVGDGIDILDFKPYLFPISSMTEEQRQEAESLAEVIKVPMYGEFLSPTPKYYDWLNKNYFDYRGLIPNGLAIDATGLNIY